MKKKQNKLEPYLKWWKQVAISIIVIPALAFSWKNIQLIWASPEKVEEVAKKVDKHETAQEQLARLVIEQQARMDKQEAVNNLQVEAMKEQLALVAELKKGKK